MSNTAHTQPRTTFGIHRVNPDNVTWEVTDYGWFATVEMVIGNTEVTMYADNITDIAKVLTLAGIAMQNVTVAPSATSTTPEGSYELVR